MLHLRRPRSVVHLLRRLAAAGLLLVALALAVRPAPGATTAGPTVPATIAARDLPVGAVLTADDLRVSRFTAQTLPAGTVPDAGSLVGRAVAGPVRAGEVLTDVRVVGPGLWSALPAGQVAAPVRPADLAVTALLRPGDRVDVLASPPDGPTVVVAAGAVVLTVPGAGSGAGGALRNGSDPGGPTGLVVLAVPAATAASLAGAATTATLTVTLGPP